jgi:outer membrane protein
MATRGRSPRGAGRGGAAASVRALSAAALLAAGHSACAETLADAIAQAYRTNPTLVGSRYDARAADEDVVQARAQLRPTAEFDAEGGYQRTVYGRITAAQTIGPTAFGLSNNQVDVQVDQPLYTGGKATAARRIAAATVMGSRDALRSTEGDLLLAVITAYVDVHQYADQQAVWRQSVDELDALNREIAARQRAGELTLTDIALAQTQLAAAREELVTTEQDLESARADYALLVGHDPGDLAEAPPLPQLPDSIDTAYDLAERQNPEIAQARDAELASRNAIAQSRAQGMPVVNLRGSATLSGPAYPYRSRDQDQNFAGSVVLTVPLTSGGLIASQTRQAEDRNQSDQVKIEAQRRVVVRAVANAWNQVVSTDRRKALLDTQRQSAAIQLKGMGKEYGVGLRSTFDVIYAEQTLRDVDIALIASRHDRYVAQATLLRQTGLLDAQTLLSGVTTYDPADHLRHVENRNALPWDGAVAAIDRAGTPGNGAPKSAVIVPTPAGTPATKPAAVSAPAGDAPLVRSLPMNPVTLADHPILPDRTNR